MSIHRHNYTEKLKKLLHEPEAADDDLRMFLWEPEVIRKGIKILKKEGLNVYSR